MEKSVWTAIRVSQENALKLKRFHQRLLGEKKIAYDSNLNDVISIVLEKAKVD